MASQGDYLKKEFTKLIYELELSDLQKQFMKSRWLDQVLWLEGRAKSAKKWSTRLRLLTIIGGVLIPGLVSLEFNTCEENIIVGWITFALSQIVAISASIEQFFDFGEKQTQYRKTAESLKSEAWKFFQLTGSYDKYSQHGEAYYVFASRVEKLMEEDVQAIVELASEKAKGEKQRNQERYNSKDTSHNQTQNQNVLPPMNGNSW